ncbi:unnamed protein product [Ceratitis capitata]|uniref:(Mediterranean fruit fly) hypothetical protein n=1 Tax=Ceratitis capitata TaxID=7213 RepID=A0A811U277_CERCA|nr:unnamed protein product [Ceratitis capitata]
MPICKESLEQMQGACRKLLKENISFAARNIANGELAAVAINHLICSQPETATFLDKTQKTVPPAMKCIREFLDRIEMSVDILKLWQIDCVFEIVFLSTSPKYAKRGLASSLSEYSIEYARRLKQGTLPPEELPAAHLLELKPSAVCSIFTSIYTQRIGRKFNFEILNELPYTDITFEGHTFAERIDPLHKCSTFEACGCKKGGKEHQMRFLN